MISFTMQSPEYFLIKLCQIALVWSLVVSRARASYKTVCYYESWAVYRRVDAKLGADFSVDPPPCTHLIYAFAVIKDGVLDAFDPLVDLDGDGQYGGYQKFNLITKSAKPAVTLLAVGGWNAGSQAFSDIAMDPDSREDFANQAITYLRRHGFQGLDIDWEYPADREGSRPEDKDNFSLLLQDIRAAFDAEELSGGNKRLLLTAALSPHPDKVDKSYDLGTIGQYVDFVNLMTYDYARAGWSMEIKPHNPLWKRPEDTTWQSQLNGEWAVQTMIKSGIPAEKVVLGIPTYGATYKINPNQVPKIHGSHLGAGDAGPITKEKGYLAYSEICRRMKLETGWITSMDQSGVPVCYRNNEWLSYESPKSARNKALFAMRYKLGGAMVWSLSSDDFNGFCFGKKYPLTQTLRDTFDASSKMMGRDRVDAYGLAIPTEGNGAPSADSIPQYCVSDAKSGRADCQAKVYCPEINRNFLPYELSCVQTLGKCSYPKLQICDVPKLVKGSKPKFRLYMGDERPANITCSSGMTVKTSIDVITLKDKCKKQSLTCQGNQLGGYNILNYICPSGSDFDTTLKVCKIPDTVDPDDDPCTDQQPTNTALGYPRVVLTTTPFSYLAAPVNAKGPQRPGYQAQNYQPFNPFAIKFPEPENYFDNPVVTQATPLAPEIADPQTSLSNDGQSSQIDQQVAPERDSSDDKPVSDSQENSDTQLPMSMFPPQPATYPTTIFTTSAQPVTFPRIPQPSPALVPFKFPSSPGLQTSSFRSPFPTQKIRSKPVSKAEMPAPSADDAMPNLDDRGRSRLVKPMRGVCGPIGARIPNPRKPCSTSFLVCMSPFTIVELNCARGLIFDGSFHFCVPPNVSRLCQNGRS